MECRVEREEERGKSVRTGKGLGRWWSAKHGTPVECANHKTVAPSWGDRMIFNLLSVATRWGCCKTSRILIL